MKTLFIGLALNLALVTAAEAAQSVKTPIAANGDWKAAEIVDHTLFHKDACLAATKVADGTTLEVYAKKLEGGTEYVEPTILVVPVPAAATAPAAPPAFVRGIYKDDTGVQLHLLLASTREDRPNYGLMARLADRKALIASMKKANSATVQLVTAKNKVLKTHTFSLKGSTKTIDAALTTCKLALE